jgi:hypothetical protein
MRETIFVDQQEHQIEAKPVTLVFNSSCATYYPDRIMIDPELTLRKFKELDQLNCFQIELFRIVVADVNPVTLAALQGGHIGFQHLMGLIACSLELILLKKPFGWKWPETYLHPKYQGNLADLMILLGSPEKFVAFIRHCQEMYKA